ncbi:MAG: 4Fe-4S binding protein [Chloroflexi bacterium]|nr:4Fe-4S binding protein [Chloroflexota bacterium]
MPTEFTDAQLQRMIEVRKRRPPKNLAVIDQTGCTGCEVCVIFCPADCIYWAPNATGVNSVVEVDYDLCIGCTLCAQNCPWDTIFMLPYDDALAQAPAMTLAKATGADKTAMPAGRTALMGGDSGDGEKAKKPAPKAAKVTA